MNVFAHDRRSRCGGARSAEERRRASRRSAPSPGIEVETPRDPDPRRPFDQRRDGAGQAGAHEAARHRREAARRSSTGDRRRRGGRRRRARLPQPHAEAASSGSGSSRTILDEGADYGRSAHRQGRDGQRRVRLRQPDRAHARRPLPRRGVRRCARQSARLRRLRGHARVLRQRRRRAGRRARPLGVPALPRGAGRGHRRDPRRASIRATT